MSSPTSNQIMSPMSPITPSVPFNAQTPPVRAPPNPQNTNNASKPASPNSKALNSLNSLNSSSSNATLAGSSTTSTTTSETTTTTPLLQWSTYLSTKPSSINLPQVENSLFGLGLSVANSREKALTVCGKRRVMLIDVRHVTPAAAA